jgi:nitrogen regulatory protein P-II 1
MKMIIALIRPERLEAVEEALAAVLDEGDNYRITVDTVEGRGRQAGEVEYVRGRAVKVRMVQKTRVTIAVNDAYVEKAIDAIVKGAREGNVGDGKIFVMPLEEVVRIRTGERGGKAI